MQDAIVYLMMGEYDRQEFNYPSLEEFLQYYDRVYSHTLTKIGKRRLKYDFNIEKIPRLGRQQLYSSVHTLAEEGLIEVYFEDPPPVDDKFKFVESFHLVGNVEENTNIFKASPWRFLF